MPFTFFDSILLALDDLLCLPVAIGLSLNNASQDLCAGILDLESLDKRCSCLCFECLPDLQRFSSLFLDPPNKRLKRGVFEDFSSFLSLTFVLSDDFSG